MTKKEKEQKDKQRSAKHTYKTKDRVTRIPLKTAVLPLRGEQSTRSMQGQIKGNDTEFVYIFLIIYTY